MHLTVLSASIVSNVDVMTRRYGITVRWLSIHRIFEPLGTIITGTMLEKDWAFGFVSGLGVPDMEQSEYVVIIRGHKDGLPLICGILLHYSLKAREAHNS